jgi:RsiW-degrading membrane proteinase PrsW (M82 family)
MIDIQTILFAFFGGIIPALLWLFFWLREDAAHPEPRKNILRTFLFGMLAVPVAFILQYVINVFFLDTKSLDSAIQNTPFIGLLAIIVVSISEEVTKWYAGHKGELNKQEDEEPVDDVIYMITAALGFAALENMLFLIGPLATGNTELAIISGNMRFIGATMLHVATSATIGIFLAFSHFKLNVIKKRYFFTGLILSVVLHTVFNLFIIEKTNAVFIALTGTWLITVIIIFLFEKIKKIHVEKIKLLCLDDEKNNHSLKD